MEIEGEINGLTTILCTAVFVQLLLPVAVTVYVLEDAGVNDTPFVIPPLHEYVLAPDADNVKAVPAQIVSFGFALMEMFGKELSVIVCEVVLVQPKLLVAVTV